MLGGVTSEVTQTTAKRMVLANGGGVECTTQRRRRCVAARVGHGSRFPKERSCEETCGDDVSDEAR